MKESWTVPPDEENLRVDVAVPRHVTPSSRAQAKQWIEQGWVLVEGKTVRASRLLHAGERVEVSLPPPVPAEPQPEPIPLHIVYEDDALVVIDKPADLVVHPAPGHSSGTLVNALLYHLPHLSGVGGVSRPGIVHRLDRGTSGLLVVAKNDLAHRHLARQFAARQVEKRYLVVVYGSPPKTLRIETPIGRDPRDRKKISSRSRRPRKALTEAHRLEALRHSALLSVRILTGRTHQIRVHLSESGFPVVGDKEYARRGRSRQGDECLRLLAGFPRPALHAAALAFRHPRSEKLVEFEAPMPEDMRSLLDALRAASSP